MLIAVRLGSSGLGVTAPIIGTTSIEKLQDLVAPINVKLTDEEVKYLEEPYKPQAIVGH